MGANNKLRQFNFGFFDNLLFLLPPPHKFSLKCHQLIGVGAVDAKHLKIAAKRAIIHGLEKYYQGGRTDMQILGV